MLGKENDDVTRKATATAKKIRRKMELQQRKSKLFIGKGFILILVVWN